MLYVPCADSGFRSTRTYCCYDSDCFRIMKSNAQCKESYDRRDGTTCSVVVQSCPC
jgi:hypothetical protein